MGSFYEAEPEIWAGLTWLDNLYFTYRYIYISFVSIYFELKLKPFGNLSQINIFILLGKDVLYSDDDVNWQ